MFLTRDNTLKVNYVGLESSLIDLFKHYKYSPKTASFIYNDPNTYGDLKQKDRYSDHRYAVFYIASLMHHLLCGRPICRNISEMIDLFYNKTSPVIDSQLPVAIRKIIEKSIRINIEERYQTFDELKQSLQNLV